MGIIQIYYVFLQERIMKPKGVLLIAIALTMVMGTYAQRVNRGDVCQSIPNLTTEQKQEIDKLRVSHQQKMEVQLVRAEDEARVEVMAAGT